MARPRKATVKYFYHTVEHGKTMFILERRFGIYGYAAWFKILERLGQSDNHFIDCRDPGTWEFLTAFTYADSQMLSDILDMLASLEAIDPDFWNNQRVIYCQNFVDGVKHAYSKREGDLPNRETVSDIVDLVTSGFPVPETTKTGMESPLKRVSGAGNKKQQELKKDKLSDAEFPPQKEGFPVPETTQNCTETPNERVSGAGSTETRLDYKRLKPTTTTLPMEVVRTEDSDQIVITRPMRVSEAAQLMHKYLGCLQEGGNQVTVLQYFCEHYTPERIREGFVAAAAAGVNRLGWIREFLAGDIAGQPRRITREERRRLANEESQRLFEAGG